MISGPWTRSDAFATKTKAGKPKLRLGSRKFLSGARYRGKMGPTKGRFRSFTLLVEGKIAL